MKHVKLLGLAAIAAMALMSFIGATSVISGFLFFSVSTLGATALRLGKSTITTGETAALTVTTTLTSDSSDPLSNSRKDRYAPPHISVMAC